MKKIFTAHTQINLTCEQVVRLMSRQSSGVSRPAQPSTTGPEGSTPTELDSDLDSTEPPEEQQLRLRVYDLVHRNELAKLDKEFEKIIHGSPHNIFGLTPREYIKCVFPSSGSPFIIPAAMRDGTNPKFIQEPPYMYSPMPFSVFPPPIGTTCDDNIQEWTRGILRLETIQDPTPLFEAVLAKKFPILSIAVAHEGLDCLFHICATSRAQWREVCSELEAQLATLGARGKITHNQMTAIPNSMIGYVLVYLNPAADPRYAGSQV